MEKSGYIIKIISIDSKKPTDNAMLIARLRELRNLLDFPNVARFIGESDIIKQYTLTSRQLA
jgi:hypothetical protein